MAPLGRRMRRGSETLDAPGWVRTTVVDLMAAHEATYLDHCRKYALQQAA